MTALQLAETLLSQMTQAEKAQLLRWVVYHLGETFPGIEVRPEVHGGEPCIVSTEIPVWMLERARRTGAREADLLQLYPCLRAEDLANAWAFVRAHRAEIDRKIRQNEEAE
jgi:uncharacterized protein (DUF433 family)